MITDETGNYVKSLVIGENSREDRRNGFLMPMMDQVEYACDLIKSDPELKDGYHGVAFSQGAQLLRGVAQKCPEPPMLGMNK